MTTPKQSVDELLARAKKDEEVAAEAQQVANVQRSIAERTWAAYGKEVGQLHAGDGEV